MYLFLIIRLIRCDIMCRPIFENRIGTRPLAHSHPMSGLYDSYDTPAHPGRRSAALGPIFFISSCNPTTQCRSYPSKGDTTAQRMYRESTVPEVLAHQREVPDLRQPCHTAFYTNERTSSQAPTSISRKSPMVDTTQNRTRGERRQHGHNRDRTHHRADAQRLPGV
jgi:hypothetical protein